MSPLLSCQLQPLVAIQNRPGGLQLACSPLANRAILHYAGLGIHRGGKQDGHRITEPLDH